MTFVRQHSAFKDASEVVEFASPLYRNIMQEYAELLVKSGDLRSAFAALKLACANHRIVSLALEHPEFWRDAISVQPDQASVLCDTLMSAKLHSDAYQIAHNYLHDQVRALRIAIEGNLWEEARMLPGDTTIHIQSAYERYSNDLSSSLQTLQEKGERLVSLSPFFIIVLLLNLSIPILLMMLPTTCLKCLLPQIQLLILN